MINAQDFKFVAFTSNCRDQDGVFLQKSVLLSIRELDEAADLWLKDVWDKMRQSISNYHKTRGGTPGWVSWKPHEWSKAKIPGRQKFVAWSGDVVAGFLFLRTEFYSEFDKSKQILYVENIATAPGNKRTNLWCRQLTHVGRALLAFAVLKSVEHGTSGLLGLHAADHEAYCWYTSLNQNQGGRLFHPEKTGVAAPQPHLAEHRPYFETTESGCIEFLEGYRHE